MFCWNPDCTAKREELTEEEKAKRAERMAFFDELQKARKMLDLVDQTNSIELARKATEAMRPVGQLAIEKL